ncbi:MAG: polyphosphate kinase 2 family protein [Gammaproteobacteria bacterium]|nr:polyphosphate kinase 2 family protein [Gammaproteobacteria bacterium]
MIEPPLGDWGIAESGEFKLDDARTKPPSDESRSKKELEKALKKTVKSIAKLQRKLFADDRFSLLLVFQAMDAAGKDGTIRAVMSGVNPAGCQVFSFKSPSVEELEHDYLWRTNRRLPERGRIGIFNRSYYEEVLAVRVNPHYLENQRIPLKTQEFSAENIWQERFGSIRDSELHLARNGTVILKFFLNVSKEEQKNRFLDRLTDPDRYWKFSKSDLPARQQWDEYMDAYQSVLEQTSRAHAPWFSIPADDKPYMRLQVAKTIEDTLKVLPLRYPQKTAEELAFFDEHIALLKNE